MNYYKYKVQLILLLVIILSVGAGGWIRNSYGPAFEEFKNKDPEQFSIIVEEIKNLNFIKARNLAIDLNRMTPNEIQWNRYRRLKQKILSDDNFRLEVNAIRKGVVDRAREEQNKNHSIQISESNTRPNNNFWLNLTPWQKGLVLRETCQRILSKNKKFPANFCDQAVPLGREEHFVTRALENLKLEMDYFDFSRMLTQVGIPEEKVISKSGKLLKMTGSLGGA